MRRIRVYTYFRADYINWHIGLFDMRIPAHHLVLSETPHMTKRFPFLFSLVSKSQATNLVVWVQFHIVEDCHDHDGRHWWHYCSDGTKKAMVAFGFNTNMLSWYVLILFISLKPVLTHWGRVKRICVCNLTIIGSDNGLWPCRRQATA